MRITDFSRIYKFVGDDSFIYFIPLKVVNDFKPQTLSHEIACVIKKHSLPHLHVNVNMQDMGRVLVLHNIPPKQDKANAIMVKHGHLLSVLLKLGVMIDEAVNSDVVIVYPIEWIRRQEARKRASLNLPIKPICGRVKEEKFSKWIDDTYKELKKTSTKSEEQLYHRLERCLGKRIKRQAPFVIDGKVYYADLCVKSLKLIIEVDGGYHSTAHQKIKDEKRDEAFKSIGYTTIRCSNDEATSKNYSKELLKHINFLKEEKKNSKRLN